MARNNTVAVVLAIHRPKLSLLRRQVATILGQQGVKPKVFAVVGEGELAAGSGVAEILADVRIEIVPAGTAAGIREAFLKGLARALAASSGEAWSFAFADQDDIWHPSKLDRTLAVLSGMSCGLVHCDARVLREDGTLVAASLHRYEAREADQTLLGNLLLNATTGMTAVFSREVAELALRLSQGLGSAMLHDHVAAIAAAAIGRIAWLDETLVDYVQHDANQLGAVERRAKPWWTRSLSAKARRQYRLTSAALFADRRAAAQNLIREGCDREQLSEMFLCGPPPGIGRLVTLYLSSAAGLFRRGQPRRARMCLRLLDSALQELKRRSSI